MWKTSIFAAATLLVAGTANAATINFEGLTRGTVVSAFDITGAIVAGPSFGTVSATGGTNQAMVFDSNNPTGGDNDLDAPFVNATDLTTTLMPGNILIISEDGDINDPDDNGSGGLIRFDFASAITFTGFDVFDDVTNFIVRSNFGDVLTGINIASDNQFLSFAGLDVAGVTWLEFDFGSHSGAIDNISFLAPVPLPASLPLLLAGFGGLGFVARRRRKHLT